MSLTLRLSLTYLLITLAGVLLLGAGLILLTERYLAEQQARELGAQAELFTALLDELAATPAALQALAPALPGGELLPPDTEARLFSGAGALLAGDPALGPFPSRAALPLLRPAVPLPASQVAGRAYVARAIGDPAAPIGVLELSRDSMADQRLLDALRDLTIRAALVAALVVAAVSLLVARGIARPVLRLTQRAEALAARYAPPGAEPKPASDVKVSSRTPLRVLRGSDELRALQHSLDWLDDGLRAYVARIGELEQARSRFYRSLSHELRTPITALRAGLENLADTALPEQQATFATLEGEAARLGRLVEELLRPPDDGTLALTARTPVNLAELAAEVAALLVGRASRAGVIVRADGASVTVRGDRDRLKQALINLVDNALRASPTGGAVLIRTARVRSSAQLIVEDEGPGVPPALAEPIWKRGVRGGDPATDGSAGLGLAIVREIAAAHGGRAYLDAEHAPGARFVIELPAVVG